MCKNALKRILHQSLDTSENKKIEHHITKTNNSLFLRYGHKTDRSRKD